MLEVSKMTFRPREKRPKYQVRFWSKKSLYNNFREKCESEGLVVQDVFNEFMEQFLEIKTQESEG